MNTITLNLNGDTIRADVISFEERLNHDSLLKHEGTDDDWEIFSYCDGRMYVAYQQCGVYDVE